MASVTAAFSGVVGLREWPGLNRPRHIEFDQFLSVLGLTSDAPPPVVKVAQAASTMPLPPHWSEQVDHIRGAVYFYNDLHDESLWEHPMAETFKDVMDLVARRTATKSSAAEVAEAVAPALAEAQARAVNDLGDWAGPLGSIGKAGPLGVGTYYFNRRTGQTQWEDPRERWQYDLHVRYSLLAGFVVSEERRQDAERKAAEEARAAAAEVAGSETPRELERTLNCNDHTPRLAEFTATLESLASSLSLVTSTLEGAMSTIALLEQNCLPQPQKSTSSLPLPPRSTGGSGSTTREPRFLSRLRRELPAIEKVPTDRRRGSKPPPPPQGAPPRTPSMTGSSCASNASFGGMLGRHSSPSNRKNSKLAQPIAELLD